MILIVTNASFPLPDYSGEGNFPKHLGLNTVPTVYMIYIHLYNYVATVIWHQRPTSYKTLTSTYRNNRGFQYD